MDNQIIVLNDDLRVESFAEEFAEIFNEAGIKYVVKTCVREEDYIEFAKDSVIIFNQGTSKITKKIIESLPKLKAIIRRGVGYDNIDIEAARERGIIVCNTPGFCEEEVATHAIALLLSFLRRIPHWHNWTHAGNWNKKNHAFTVEKPYAGMNTLEDENVGIIGFGLIGKNIYKKLLAFKVKFFIYDKYIKVDNSFKVEQVDLEELLKKCKYVILCCPLTDETRHLIDEDSLRVMRKDSVIINVGKGALINENALIRCLIEKKIGGAALDVFEESPINKKNMLLKLDNVVISPHLAGMSPKSMRRSFEIALEDIVSIAKGQTPILQD